MTDGDQVTIHQTLHGYRDGHRLLNKSVEISQHATKTLLVMSDASGPNLPANHKGYLTGYPVPDTKYYALAKTWPAPETSRPGCVWTHTLLVNVSDLGVIKNTSQLLKQFKRPELDSDHNFYAEPITLDLFNNETENESMDLGYLIHILIALYLKPTSPVVVDAFQDKHIDTWILAIWDQQWPRLKRSFRFCTLALADRSTAEMVFDLQIVPGTSESHSTWRTNPDFINYLYDSNISDEPGWVRFAVDDLILPGKTTFRDFLWRYGADTTDGREAFATLAGVWVALERDHLNINIDTATSELDKYSNPIPTLTNYIIKLISSTQFTNQNYGKFTLQFLANNFSKFTGAADKGILKSLSKFMWQQDKPGVWKILKKKGVKESVIKSFAPLITPQDALDGTKNDKQLLAKLITFNTSLSNDASIWQTGDSIFESVDELTTKQPSVRKKIIDALLKFDSIDLVRSTFRVFGDEALNVFITKLDEGKLDDIKTEPWLNYISYQSELLTPILESGIINKISTLSILSSVEDPCHKNINDKFDCWVKAIDETKTDSIEGDLQFCTFLLARSLCRISPDTGRLIQLSFEPVYKAAEKSMLSLSDWKIIQDKLPHLPWHVMDWDWCYRLSLGIAELFVEQNISGEILIKLTSDEKLFKLLINRIKANIGGNSYLKNVLDELPLRRKGIKKYREFINSALKKY